MSELLLPPHNLEAERSVLGGILLDPEIFYDVSEILSHSDFYRAAHQTVYRSICDLVAKCKPVDAVQLCEDLTTKGVFEKIGGNDLLLEIMNSVPHAANTVCHAGIVKEKSTSRQIINAAQDVVREGYSNQHTAQELTTIAEQKIFAVTQDKELGQVYQMPQAISMYSQILERRRSGEVDGLTTGFADLDDMILGMGKKQLIYLAARPGQGKSSLAMDICWHVSFNLSRKVLFVSLEMSAEELTERLVSCIARIDSKRLKNPYLLDQLTPEENTRLMEAMALVTQSQLTINDCTGQTVWQIASAARRMKARDGLDLLVIDYLGKIRRPESKKSTNDSIADVSGALKDLTGELEIPILCLHQLNRESVREGARPAMHQLRDSGALEQDAHHVWLLHNQIPKTELVGSVELIVEKNRNGATGILYLTYEKPFTHFSSNIPEGAAY